MCKPEAENAEPTAPEWIDELPDEAVLVRGGIMDPRDLTKSATAHFLRHGVYALSLWSYPTMDAAEIAHEVGVVADADGVRLLPNPEMRHSTAERLRELGYDVTPGGGLRGHVTLALDELPDHTEWARLAAAFSVPEPNPIALRMRQSP